jgi:hypothetical protein
MRKHHIGLGLVLAVACLSALPVAAAFGDTPITSFSALPSETQAGGHPDLGISFSVKNRLLQESENFCQCEDAKDTTIHFPAGFIGFPHATPQCSIADFAANTCPIDSQVGMANVKVTGLPSFNQAVYNLIPPPTRAGLLGFKILGAGPPQFEVLSGRTGGDFGLDATVASINHGLSPLESFKQVLWGVPADPSHDRLRLKTSDLQGFPGYLGSLCDLNNKASSADPNTMKEWCPEGLNPTPTASNSPLRPFLQAPTNCDASPTSSLDVLSYDGGITHAESTWPQETGCSQLSFNPSLYAQPTTAATDSPSGIDVDLQIPQPPSPFLPSASELRAATVVLPQGFSINPNAADGKVACTDAEAHFGTTEEAQCPEFARIGSLSIDSAALPAPIPGFVNLGQPLADNRYRIFLVANGFATHVKIAGVVTPDPTTGQLEISFSELPQSPLSDFNMHFFGSERGVLATPIRCGTYPVTSVFTPWDSSLAKQTSTQFFTLVNGPGGKPCPRSSRPFAPTTAASSASNKAGSHTDFAVEVSRQDGDQDLTGLNVKTPPGFSATLKGIPYCPQAAIDQLSNSLYSGSSELTGSACPAASQIGTAEVGAGAGSRPIYLPGKVYLAGPYKGAPLSLLVVVPAVSGPYDLGNVTVRAAIHVDPLTAQVTTVSDPLPQILEGIPLRTRFIQVNLDRPDFGLNPTNCEPLAVSSQILGDEGAESTLSNHFQVGGCSSLPFRPKLSVRLTGGVNRLGHPAIHAVLSTAPGEANPRSVVVTLPGGELLDNSHIGSVCSKVDFAAEHCPGSSRLGYVTLSTPLLDHPLSGPIYLRSSGAGLPDLALDLNGQLHVVALAGIDSVHGAYRTSFRAIPDVPLGTVSLDLAGGAKGLLQNSEGLCGTHKSATAVMVGQSDGSITRHVSLQVACRSRPKPHRVHKVRIDGRAHR